MLKEIHIRDLATIEELHLTLNAQNTMITGETGAGKSIFIEAIELGLGGRASQNIIRPGKEKAEISLIFDITHFPAVIEALEKLDLYHGTAECIIRRVIVSEGPSRCYVNGSPSTVQWVKELGEQLFHLHGQHEQQVLLKTETQRDMLDRYADHLPLVTQLKKLAEQWKKLTQQIQVLQSKMLERSDRSEYLHFQLDELQTLQLQAGEWETLEVEHHKLTHADELLRHIEKMLQQLNNDDQQNIFFHLHDMRRTLDAIQSVEPHAKEWAATLNSIFIQLSDLTAELKNYLASAEFDPEKLHLIEERVSQIFNLSRKHKIQPNELFFFQERLNAELQSLTSCDDDIKKLSQEQEQVAAEYAVCAEKLSHSRQKAAVKLAKEITTTMRSLSLPHGEFSIALEKEALIFSPHGNEKIIFLIKTNPDQSPLAITKVISGGELSRLSLAAHLALAHRMHIPTLVFDEVDTGLSGATAEKIGKLLRKLGESYQVFCVTHQPQVAACGHHHVLVEKYFLEQRTHTRLRLLSQEERTREIARMLGGEKITQKTLEHAQEILLRA